MTFCESIIRILTTKILPRYLCFVSFGSRLSARAAYVFSARAKGSRFGLLYYRNILRRTLGDVPHAGADAA